jgi:protein-L-isoaspartate(D-aspartate) O-methyltransferase
MLFICFFMFSFMQHNDNFESLRLKMVEEQIVYRGVKNEAVLSAMRKVPRHLFVSDQYRKESYDDYPLPIGYDQTISQPYIVALMTELLDPKKTDRILEVGTGSGYQAAVLAEIVKEVYTVEIVPELALRAEILLKEMKYENITAKSGDGYAGWKEHAPFDGIIVTASAPRIPEPLVEQLKEGGRLVIPVGDFSQDLKLLIKEKGKMKEHSIIPVRFVPMTGIIQQNH